MADEIVRSLPPITILKDEPPRDPRSVMERSDDTSHAAPKPDDKKGRTAHVISRNAPIAIQKEDRKTGAMGEPQTMNFDGHQTSMTGPRPVKPAEPVEVTRTAEGKPAKPKGRTSPRGEEPVDEPAPARQKATTRVTFQSDRIGKMQIRCLRVLTTETTIALAFDADGDRAEPPALGSENPMDVTVATPSQTFKLRAMHCDLSFEDAGVYWLVLVRLPVVTDD